MGKRTLINLAFEDVDPQAVIGTLVQTDEGLVDTDERELAQAQDDAREVDTLISTTERVQGIAMAVGQAAEQGGLSEPGARALDLAVESLMQGVGEASKRLSMESFSGGRYTRTNATKVAMEDMGENIRRLVVKLIKWIKHIATVCYDMVERILRGANAVIAKADDLYKLASGMSNVRVDRSKLSTISNGALKNFFNENGKPLDARRIAQLFEIYSGDMEKAFNADKLFGPAVAGLKAMDDYIHQHSEKAVDLVAVEGFAAHACEKFVSDSLHDFKPKHDESADLMVRRLPFGNADLVISFAKSAYLEDKRIGYSSSISADNVNVSADLNALSPQEVMNLMSILTARMNSGLYHQSKKIKSSIYDITKRVEKQSQQLSDRQRLMGASVTPSLHLLKTISESSMTLTRLLYSYTGITTRRLLSYARASLAAYDKARIA